MRATDIASRLAAQVEGVVMRLLPKGRRIGHEWRVGDVEGEPGRSLGVHLDGPKAGVWSDFSTGASGDLIGLWMAVRQLDLRAACKEAMDYLGVREDRLDPPPVRYQRPDPRRGIVALAPEHRSWLSQERKLPEATLAAYRLRTRHEAIMFPYLRDGRLIATKYRALPKRFWRDERCEPCLFGWQAQPPEARSLLITEGELDALAWHAYGFPALSVPLGGGGGDKHTWITTEFDRLALFDTIYVNMDADRTGQEAARTIVERLGRDRCRVVRLPRHDANQCLMDGVPTEEMAHALREARTLDPSELRQAADLEAAVVAEMHRTDEGIYLPWEKTHACLRLRPGELSLWAGINGHGKSAVINHIVADAAMAGVRCCVASMEYRASLWLFRLSRCLAGTPTPTSTYLRHTVRALRDRLWLFDIAGTAKATRLLEVFRYARRRYAIDLFVIDNLSKCGFDDDDYTGQKRFVEDLSDLARLEQTHVALVAHMRKGDSEDHPAGKMAIKGSGGIADMADTIVEIWRNKPRERWREAHADDGVSMPTSIYRADTLLNVLKQRATGEEPCIALWFDRPTTQFLSTPDAMPRPVSGMPLHAIDAAQESAPHGDGEPAGGVTYEH